LVPVWKGRSALAAHAAGAEDEGANFSRRYDMKANDTLDAIGVIAVAGALTVVLAAAGVVQVAAAGVELLIASPLAGRKKAVRRTGTIATVPTARTDVRLPRAA